MLIVSILVNTIKIGARSHFVIIYIFTAIFYLWYKNVCCFDIGRLDLHLLLFAAFVFANLNRFDLILMICVLKQTKSHFLFIM